MPGWIGASSFMKEHNEDLNNLIPQVTKDELGSLGIFQQSDNSLNQKQAALSIMLD